MNTNECVFMFMHAEVDSSVIGMNNKYLTAGIRQFVFAKMDLLLPPMTLCGAIFPAYFIQFGLFGLQRN